MTDTRLIDIVRDTVYVAIGTGVLAFQRAQVVRRDLERRLGGSPGEVIDIMRDRAERMVRAVAGPER